MSACKRAMEAVAHGRGLRKVRLIPFESHCRIEKGAKETAEETREGKREKKSGVGPCGFPFTRESADM